MSPDFEATIVSLASALAGVRSQHVDPRTPFALLGLDSLATVELASAIERATGLELPPELMSTYPNARALAMRLQEQLSNPDHVSERLDPFALMLADSVLPEDVRAAVAQTFRLRAKRSGGPPTPWRRLVRPASPTASLREARRILLTGATGFLGRWVVREVVESSAASLLCLVRPGSEAAEARLHASLARAGVTHTQILERVEIIEGDLAQPRLGLTRTAFNELSSRIDAICHAGASVNWIHSYQALRAANVLGTIELLRLAAKHGTPFHFVSSVSACYSTSGPRHADETFDALPHIRGVHLGYAQTKVVGEALVRQAADLGLPVTVYRPALIGGHSTADDFNADDLLSLLVRGCVRMGTAPDLDWTLDVLPVDVVARRIVALSHLRQTLHLLHSRPRHWRECVLWMRLYGYPVRLISYGAWVHQLEREVEAAAAQGTRHPLAPLRRFFVDRPDGAEGLTLPQLYEDVRRTHALGDRTHHSLDERAASAPELDASLLDHYFRAFRSKGHIEPPNAPIGVMPASPREHPDPAGAFDATSFSRAVGDRLGTIVSVDLLTRGSRHSIVSDLTSWRSRHAAGLFGYRLHTARTAHDVVLKVKPRDRDVMAVGEALARICDERAGAAYARWQERVGVAASHLREVEIYRQTDPRFTRHLPGLLGSIADERSGMWALVLERVTDATHFDSADHEPQWDADAIHTAIRGLAALQSVWYGRDRELLSQNWIGFERSSQSMVEMTDLWSALAAHARSSLCAWADPAISAIQRRLIAGIANWWRVLETGPRTLIHNDFNPRNICLRRTSSGRLLCAYDWELATIGAPQRDLAELLCFVLSQESTRADVDAAIECHRLALERETGRRIRGDGWLEGFRGALYDVLIDRLSMYALIHRIRRQPFLPRVVRTWLHLYRFFPLMEDA